MPNSHVQNELDATENDSNVKRVKRKTLKQICIDNGRLLDDGIISTKNYGNRFEVLIKRYLESTKDYHFSNVWTWDKFPHKNQFLLGSADTGIDLVAKTDLGDYYAIQCKAHRKTILKRDIDSFVATSTVKFFDGKSYIKFAHKILFTTASSISANARKLLQVSKITLKTIHHLDQSDVDWGLLENPVEGQRALLDTKTPRKHQKTAIEEARRYYASYNRGKLIMACGTGKTYTSLKILEDLTPEKGIVLYLVPSIALMSQSIRAYNNDASRKLQRLCICSDSKASATDIEKNDTDLSATALLYPATTDLKVLKQQWTKIKNLENRDLTIVFSTYQSIQVVSDFAKESDTEFDLVICDEAHRTASFKFRTKEAKNFVKVHDNNIVPAKKRLYMTATKRVYDTVQKEDASRDDAVVYSMDDPTYYGETFYELTFGEAIEKGLLSDYEVVIFHAHPENYKNLRDRSEDEIKKGIPVEYVYPEWKEGKRVNKKERNLKVSIEKSAKLHGCFDVFQKKNLEIAEKKKLAGDTSPMKTVLLFDNTIKESKNTVGAIQKFFANNQDNEVNFSATHIDGTMDTLTRSNRISWLEDGIDSETGKVKYDCRALSNVRCLSEGVDVPALDAIVFLAHRTGLIDIVQSVGRVMRKAPGKEVGYIIIPIVVDSHEDKQSALESSKYNTVWKVLNALKSHDTRLADEIAQAKFFGDVSRLKNAGRRITEGDPDNPIPDVQRKSSKSLSEGLTGKQLTIYLEELQNPFRGVLLKKVGTIRAWSDWAEDIATILENEKKRIRKLIRRDQVKILRDGQEISINAKTVFHDFLIGLKVHLNQGVSEEDALDILAQQSVTKGVFDALYPNYFSESNNQVGTQLQRLVEFFKDDRNTEIHENLQGFYDSVQNRVKNIKSPEGKTGLIKELYDKFFALALPNLAETLGIVYTPIEIVDFIIQSTEDILQREFGQSLSDESVNILDPFTGTGTFITRLLQSDVIRNEDFVRKYKNEIHASEIVLLAYYMADTNIESVYVDEIERRGIEGVDRNLNFDNILLRDTFVTPTVSISKLFSENYEKILLQDQKKIQVIIGNPPYSVGQTRANDDLKNQSYPDLQNRIYTTYAKETIDTIIKVSLYDSYFKAFRWASDRISAENGGGLSVL